ncbi:MAG: hypothetical protein MJ235_06140 [archaeon]|nr:hypothetical protein [archaeon]
MSIILLTILLTILILMGSVLSLRNEESEEAEIINEIKIKYPVSTRYYA